MSDRLEELYTELDELLGGVETEANASTEAIEEVLDRKSVV